MTWTGKCKYDGAKLNWISNGQPFPLFECEKCHRKFRMVEQS